MLVLIAIILLLIKMKDHHENFSSFTSLAVPQDAFNKYHQYKHQEIVYRQT